MLGIFAESLMMAVRLSAPLRGEDFARLKREDEDYIRQRRAALGRGQYDRMPKRRDRAMKAPG